MNTYSYYYIYTAYPPAHCPRFFTEFLYEMSTYESQVDILYRNSVSERVTAEVFLYNFYRSTLPFQPAKAAQLKL